FQTVFCHTKKPPKVRFSGLTFGGQLINLSLFIMEIELAFQTNNLLIFPIFIKNRLVNAFHPC
ncbi:hypothetical protein, partial [Listeria monocytogenes]|uniref:hypothetical protein n=1 Tax=Listeria monocytogenes TaxID=1639 RepID=UPI00195B6B8D